jgi:hypothetical protein
MPVEMRSVYSSHIDEIGYDHDTEELHVKYSSGKTTVYDGVPLAVAAAVGAVGQSPPSIGEALHAHVRGKYGHRYI